MACGDGIHWNSTIQGGGFSQAPILQALVDPHSGYLYAIDSNYHLSIAYGKEISNTNQIAMSLCLYSEATVPVIHNIKHDRSMFLLLW